MASFFSVDYWKALYFKAMGGQETAVDPNAMSGSFAGSSSWAGTLTSEGTEEVRSRSLGGFDPYYYKKRKKKPEPEPVSKGFDKDWKPPAPRPVPVVAEEVLARQLKALDTAQAALKRAAIEAERRAREAEEEDEEEVALLLLS